MIAITRDFFIDKIKTTKKFTNDKIFIDLEGKNLIITGDNGCGKTKLLEGINNVLETLIVTSGDNSVEALTAKYKEYEREFSSSRPGDAVHDFYKTRYNRLKEQVESLNKIDITINEIHKFKEKFHTRNAFIKFFEARREYKSGDKKTIDSVSSFIRDYTAYSPERNEEKAQIFFENYVSSLVNYGILHDAKGDKNEARRVDEWFNKINLDLKVLFEDDSFNLSFDINSLSLQINQKDKEPYGLSQLSSGYSSILAIYAELLMCVELNKLPMQELEGVVLIDEIDAHLHVSLQKVIFAFFRKAFPKLQFIITTHSPFVVQSVNDAIIYDLSKLEQLDDLSMYSYESITKGLLGESSDSDILEKIISELEDILEDPNKNKEKLKVTLDKMLPFKSKMHPKARAFYNVGINKLLEIELENEGE
jgi:predicted ATP-binding protein involved in virulence